MKYKRLIYVLPLVISTCYLLVKILIIQLTPISIVSYPNDGVIDWAESLPTFNIIDKEYSVPNKSNLSGIHIILFDSSLVIDQDFTILSGVIITCHNKSFLPAIRIANVRFVAITGNVFWGCNPVLVVADGPYSEELQNVSFEEPILMCNEFSYPIQEFSFNYIDHRRLSSIEVQPEPFPHHHGIIVDLPENDDVQS